MKTRLPLVDVLAQLRRRWSVVVGGGLLGLVVGFGVTAPQPVMVVVAIAVVAGLAVGFAAAFGIVRLHPRVTTVEDVRRVTGLPVVGQLPSSAIDSDSVADRPVSRRMRTSLREAVMNTRALAGGRLPQRLVLARTNGVSEAAGADGGMARALAESGHAAALLDTDLESTMLVRPSTLETSHFDGSPLERSPLDEAARTDAAGYELVPVPDRVASSRPQDRLIRVEALFASLGERYDVTVAQAASDSGPLPLRTLAPVADAVLLVVRSNRTTVESLLALYGELLSIGVEPLGILLTGVAARHRVLLRSTWAPGDFRSIVSPAAPVSTPAAMSAPPPVSVELDEALPTPKTAGFSIADLVGRIASPTAQREA
ncbi:hypothetical protein AX769_12540 [Frondihabitans sp. PAMC 28766]|uniref:hypothetical protein n=1 Tax=Frondihabitans sp. PAMC 28766 TaxID=1795630 RepID=UPI00078B3FA5|nr:hypothetical protein [Frondihabitans sp. PAMC 28766]AMM20818.1 hypothetical protein AX769_12540 [Frondihabitans sp. PAMC 28766]